MSEFMSQQNYGARFRTNSQAFSLKVYHTMRHSDFNYQNARNYHISCFLIRIARNLTYCFRAITSMYLRMNTAHNNYDNQL